jgi:hypothetical protein
MKLGKPVLVFGWMLLALAVFCAWYMVAADYGYSMVAGTYVYKHAGESSTLVLNTDRTFMQQRVRSGMVEQGRGEWYRYGEGGIGFSEGFLPVADIHAGSDRKIHGQVAKKILNLIPAIVFGDDWVHGPRFTRQFLHSRDLEKQ